MDYSSEACLITIIIVSIFLVIISVLNKKSMKNTNIMQNIYNTHMRQDSNFLNYDSIYSSQNQKIYCKKCGRSIPSGFNECPYCKEIPKKVESEKKEDHKHRDSEKETYVKIKKETIKCPYCGEEIDKDLVICPSCGKFIEEI
jgi:hypothetical protein